MSDYRRKNNCVNCSFLKYDTEQTRYDRVFYDKYDCYSPIYNDKYSNDRYLFNQYKNLSYLYYNPCTNNKFLIRQFLYNATFNYV